jgi:histidinol-phosphatase (PHP family)
MKPHEIEGYVNSVLSLKKEYENDIRIYLGFEAEYYPQYFDKMLEMIEPYPYDYLILGQHFLKDESSESHIARLANDYNSLVLYVNECIEALATGKFFYIAHPDIVNFKGDPRLYRSEMTRLCKAAKSANIPLEINLLGLREGREYPRIDFWKIAADIGNDVILGSDSHAPNATARETDIRAAMEIVNGFSLHLIEPTEPKIS